MPAFSNPISSLFLKKKASFFSVKKKLNFLTESSATFSNFLKEKIQKA